MPQGADQRRFELEATLLEAQLKSAVATGKPDVAGTLGVRRLEAFDDEALVLSFSMPIGLSDRSELARSRVRAEQSGLDERRKAAELERYSSLFSSYEELKHAHHEYEALKERMVPAAERALALAQRGYDDARYSFLQVAQARGVLHSLQNERIAAATRYHDLLTDIERTTAISGVSAPMNKRILIILASLLVLGGCGGDTSKHARESEGEHGSAADDFERGPHRGRLLRDGDFSLEVTIFETGVPPQFHLYAYRGDKPVPASEVNATIELSRLGWQGRPLHLSSGRRPSGGRRHGRRTAFVRCRRVGKARRSRSPLDLPVVRGSHDDAGGRCQGGRRHCRGGRTRGYS